MLIRDILRAKGQEVITIAPDAAVQEAMRVLARHRIGALVVWEGAIRGILSERDLLCAGADDLGRLAAGRVADLMTVDVITASPDASIHDVMDIMTENRVRHLPIVDDDGLCGLISIGDVVNAVRHSVEAENHHLHAYIAGNPV